MAGVNLTPGRGDRGVKKVGRTFGFVKNLGKSEVRWSEKLFLAWHRHCDVYYGARETVGGSSVSSGCWGEDSNHEYGWGGGPPPDVAPLPFLKTPKQQQR